MADILMSDFDDRLNGGDYPQQLRDIVAFLRTTIDQAGPVDWTAHNGASSCGLRAKRESRIVCCIDPKPTAGHVCVQVPSAEQPELVAAGTVHRRKGAPSWVDVKTLAGAQALVAAIGRGYADAGTQLRRRIPRKGRLGTAESLVNGTQPSEQTNSGGGDIAGRTHAPAAAGSVRQHLDSLGFKIAGFIRPIEGGRACRFELTGGSTGGTVVYALVVGNELKKCGDTGRKAATLSSRMNGCALTINQILRGQLTGPFSEHFKQRAPSSIAAGVAVEVWAMQASPDECGRMQEFLNEHYDTIRTGWANRLK